MKIFLPERCVSHWKYIQNTHWKLTLAGCTEALSKGDVFLANDSIIPGSLAYLTLSCPEPVNIWIRRLVCPASANFYIKFGFQHRSA
jgi:hypothetical protein